jgi:hypothetical protein
MLGRDVANLISKTLQRHVFYLPPENDDGSPSRASSISCNVAPRVASEAPNIAASGGSQEKQAEPAISDVNSLHVGFVGPSCHDMAVDGGQSGRLHWKRPVR